MLTEIFAILLIASLSVLFGTARVTLATSALYLSTVALAIVILLVLNKSSWKARWKRILVTFIYPYTWSGVVGIFIATNSPLAFQIIALAMTCAGGYLFYKKMKS